MPLSDIQAVIDQIERGETGDIVSTLTHLTELVPTSLTTYVLLARAFEAEQQWRAALSAWRSAHFLMPNSPVVNRGIQRCALAIAGERTHPQHLNEPESPAIAVEEKDAGQEVSVSPEAERVPDRSPSFVERAADQEKAGGDDDFVDKSSRSDTLPAEQHEVKAEERQESPQALSGEEPSVTNVPQSAGDLEEYADLDRLIKDLESARIVPDPDQDEYPTLDLEDDVDDVVSETLARIYAAQQQYGEAARVYELLAAQHPEDAGVFKKKAEEMRTRASEM